MDADKDLLDRTRVRIVSNLSPGPDFIKVVRKRNLGPDFMILSPVPGRILSIYLVRVRVCILYILVFGSGTGYYRKSPGPCPTPFFMDLQSFGPGFGPDFSRLLPANTISRFDNSVDFQDLQKSHSTNRNISQILQHIDIVHKVNLYRYDNST